MTAPYITPTRLRELIRFADDLGADIDQEYSAMQKFRDIASALRTLQQLTDPANTSPVNVETRHE